MSFLQSPLSIPLCIVFVYIFIRGLLGIFYEVASWTVKILNGPDNEGESK
jgi:hypothetical protein